MGGAFDPKNDLWRTVSLVTDVCGLSFLWVVACLPVVTIGPATAALYFAVVRHVRRREDGAFRAFFRSFRMNLRQGVLATLIILLPAFLLQLGWRMCRTMAASASGGYGLLAFYSLLMVLPLGALMYLFPLLGRFTFSQGDLFRTAARLTLAHLPTSLCLVILFAVGAMLCLQFVLPLFFLPVLVTLASSLLLEKVFRRYAPELEEEEEPEVQGDLGN